MWCRTLDGDVRDGVAELVVGAAGEAYLVGNVWAGAQPVVVARVTPAGSFDWIMTYGDPSASDSQGIGIALDSNGYVYAVGYSLYPGSLSVLRLNKYSQAGLLQWSRTYRAEDGTVDTCGTSVSVLGNTVFVGGIVFKSLRGIPLRAAFSALDGGILRESTTDYCEWGNVLPSPTWSEMSSYQVRAVDASHVYWGAVWPKVGAAIGAIAVTDSFFNIAWTRTGDNLGVCGAYPVERVVPVPQGVLSVANLALTCGMGGPCVVKPREAVLLRYTSTGQLEWSSMYMQSGTTGTEAYSAVVDSRGNIYCAGPENAGTSNSWIWVAKFRPDHTLEWSRSMYGYRWTLDPGGCSHFDYATSVGLTLDERVLYVGGQIDNGTLTGNYQDLFVCAYALVPPVPAPPTSLAATDSCSGVLVSWQPSASSTVTGYSVYRATESGGQEARIASLPSGAKAYADTSVAAGSSYWYRVTARAGPIESDPTNWISVFHAECYNRNQAPPAPGAWLDRNAFDHARGEVLTVYALPPRKGEPFARVYTASGRLVRSALSFVDGGTGYWLATWDGRTSSGALAARGVYLIRVTGGGLDTNLKVVAGVERRD